MNEQDLYQQAHDVAEAAYVPYSNFHVGAAVETEDGQVFTGANVENAAYGSSICAEANAIGTAVAGGARRIKTVAVACLDASTCYPCGNCRQLMREFGVERVIVQDGRGGLRAHEFSEILPHSFGPETLGGP